MCKLLISRLDRILANDREKITWIRTSIDPFYELPRFLRSTANEEQLIARQNGFTWIRATRGR